MTTGIWRLTEGERSLAMAHAAMAVFGAGLAFSAVLRMGAGAWSGAPLGGYEVWIIGCGAIGGALALYLCRDRVGQAGPLRAAAAIIFTNLMAAVIAGTLALPIYGTMFGPFALVMILAGSPMLGLMWLANQLAVHLLLANFHAERDSIFRAGSVPGTLITPARV